MSTGWICGQEKAWPTKGSRRILVAGGNPVTGRICLADLCHLPAIIGKTRGIPWPNWAGDLWILNVININVGSCECQHSEVLLFTASSICDGLGLHSGLYFPLTCHRSEGTDGLWLCSWSPGVCPLGGCSVLHWWVPPSLLPAQGLPVCLRPGGEIEKERGVCWEGAERGSQLLLLREFTQIAALWGTCSGCATCLFSGA